MVNNLVNRDDLAWLARRGSPGRLVRALRLGARGRVAHTWGHVRQTRTHWYDVPEAVAHRARLAGGRYADHVDRLLSTHLAGRDGLVGLSVGCGTGEKEIRWASTRRFARLDAFDITDELVEEARRRARDADVSVDFYRGDIHHGAIRAGDYDLVIFEDSLHHLVPLEAVVDAVAGALVPGGLVVINDFVGPTRFQWRPEQLETANRMLGSLPDRYRRQPDGSLKQSVLAPSRMRMILTDPSEAADSDRILPVLRSRLVELELVPLGGTAVYLVLSEIAQNFIGDESGVQLLEELLAEEDELIRAGVLASDYVYAVYQSADSVTTTGATA